MGSHVIQTIFGYSVDYPETKKQEIAGGSLEGRALNPLPKILIGGYTHEHSNESEAKW